MRFVQSVRNFAHKAGAVVVGLVASIGSASAALPEAATDAIEAVQTDGLALIAAIWPVAAAVTGGLIVLGLFKRAINKAA